MDQAPYVMITGVTKGANFDTGLGWDPKTGWFMLVNSFNPERYTAHLYRLRNLDEGNVISEAANTEPYTGDVVVEIDEDEHLKFTVQPTGNTAWVEEKYNEATAQVDSIVWKNSGDSIAALTLGGDEENQENLGDFERNPNGTPKLGPDGKPIYRNFPVRLEIRNLQ